MAQLLEPATKVLLSKVSAVSNTPFPYLPPSHLVLAELSLTHPPVGATFAYPLPTSVQTFTLNYSSSLTVDPAVGQLGYLTYELRGGNFNLSSPLELSYNPSSNVAVPLFTPSESGLEVSFKSDNYLGIPTFLDDTVSPPAYKEGVDYRWYICETNAGYVYTTLAWVLGKGKPQNPSCVKADIKRVFA